MAAGLHAESKTASDFTGEKYNVDVCHKLAPLKGQKATYIRISAWGFEWRRRSQALKLANTRLASCLDFNPWGRLRLPSCAAGFWTVSQSRSPLKFKDDNLNFKKTRESELTCSPNHELNSHEAAVKTQTEAVEDRAAFSSKQSG